MNFTNSSVAGSQPVSHTNTVFSIVSQVTYWAIASVALVGNLFLCTALLRNRRDVFRKPYTVIIFSLCLTDITTAVLLFISPRYAFKETFLQPTNPLGLQLFCKLLWSRSPSYFFGIVSLYLGVLLALERWFAVVRPSQYRNHVTIKRAFVGMFVCCVIAVVLVVFSSPIVETYPDKPPGLGCAYVRIKAKQRIVISTAAFVFKSLVPAVAISALYLHMVYKLKSGSQVTQQHNSEIKKSITKVAAAASLLLIITWTPNQVTYLLFVHGKADIRSVWSQISTILVFTNSCVNPFLYGFAIRKYRKAYWEVVTCCCSCVLRAQEPLRGARIGAEPEVHAVELPVVIEDNENSVSK